MLILKHLKTLQHVSIIIQIIFRELVGSLLKSLNLKFENVKGKMWWCGSMLPHHHILHFTFSNFKFSDFNKEPTSSLKMIWIMIETCWRVF